MIRDGERGPSGLTLPRPFPIAAAAGLVDHARQGQSEPLNGFAVIESQNLLYNTSMAFRTKCIDGKGIMEVIREKK